MGSVFDALVVVRKRKWMTRKDGMMDRVSAQIQIGGTIDRMTRSIANPEVSVLHMLMHMINAADVSHEYGDVRADIPSGDEVALLEFIDSSDLDGVLQFRSDSCVGSFKDLESFLRKKQIPYRRMTNMGSGCMGEDVYWLPGMAEPLSLVFDQGVYYVPREAVWDVLNRLRSSSPHFFRIEDEISQLQRLCPEIPVIPPFTII